MLDGGPSRTSQQLDRRAPRRPEPVRRAPEEPRPTETPKAAVHHAPTAPHRKVSRPSFIERFLKPLVIVIVVLAVIVTGWLVWSNSRGFGSTIDSGKYQAVFFSNGQVYFGKLKMTGNDSMVLSKVYYLKSPAGESGASTDNPQNSSADSESGNVQLIKLGNEIHGPEDAMAISRDQVLFFENLKNDGQVAKLMKGYKANN